MYNDIVGESDRPRAARKSGPSSLSLVKGHPRKLMWILYLLRMAVLCQNKRKVLIGAARSVGVESAFVDRGGSQSIQ